jgi:hypothetical protein
MPRLEIDEFTVQVVGRRLAAGHEDDLAIPADLHRASATPAFCVALMALVTSD